MNVALCFAGQPRCVKSTFEKFIKPNILDCNSAHRIDTFVHMWFDNSMYGQSYVNAGGNPCSDIVPNDVIDFIYSAYNPMSMVIERQRKFTHTTQYTNKYPGINPEFSYSRMLSTKLVVDLLDISPVSYDIVMIGRFDWAFLNPIILDEIITSFGIYYPGNNPHGVNIGWVFGDTGSILTYSNMVYEVDRLYHQYNVPFVDEILAQKYLEMSGVPVFDFQASYVINKGHL